MPRHRARRETDFVRAVYPRADETVINGGRVITMDGTPTGTVLGATWQAAVAETKRRTKRIRFD